MPPVKSLHLFQKIGIWLGITISRFQLEGFPDVKRFYSKHFCLGTQIFNILSSIVFRKSMAIWTQ
jgi:hypothetical protein